MGNYLFRLRAPPVSEQEERQHPLYYDWTVPKWSPFASMAQPQGFQAAGTNDATLTPASSYASIDATRDSSRDISNKSGGSPAAPSAAASAKQVRDGLRDMLTSTVDSASQKPANLDTHKSSSTPPPTTMAHRPPASQIAKSTALHKSAKAAQRATKELSASSIKSMKSNDSGSSSIKRVDQTRPHTVDPKKYGQVEESAAIKAATNIHAIKVAKKSS